jgi:hypothetical protein
MSRPFDFATGRRMPSQGGTLKVLPWSGYS